MTIDELEKFRKRKRENNSRARAANPEKFRERERIRSAKRRLADIEAARARERDVKARKRNEDVAADNKRQRKYYLYDPNAAEKQRNRRYFREPDRDIRASSKLFAEGAIGVHEYVERVGEAITRSDEIITNQRKPGRPKTLRMGRGTGA